jgi:hypothetical protein
MVYERACGSPTLITGTAYAGKNVILYGGESSSRTFFSDTQYHPETDGPCCCDTGNLPIAAVQVVEPIALETRIGKACTSASAEEEKSPSGRTVIMTLGLFSVVELYRPVTIMVPTYEYTIPTKECHTDTESPCAVFDKIRFPAEEFVTAAVSEKRSSGTVCGCDCGMEERKETDAEEG